ncbi:nucleoside-diphosphate sugar epimerase [Mycobacterium kyorinense]|uniref:Nucleoside-diphosphate sugar epimerase n=1 Tax=Mycobacterium kyorinense TaxID=487514 RepID=A0A1A2YZZ6_9MYCO|nr:NmrA/HSCARG family protein [Mycobacterium kyorinense]OBI42958.1 nucleoside-diphosphate sugar epimerase [Mycobacterium kyorinense]
MTGQKLIAVVGATGSQGGGLARAILAEPDRGLTVRALTRNTQSGSAQELARAGAEVVEADLDDEKSMRRAFDGAHGAYVVTNYWVDRTPEQEAERTRGEMELAQAEIAARAARDADVAHVIWSTLEDTRDFFGDDERVPNAEGQYKVPHFDAKAEADELFVKYGVPTTFLRTAFYFNNIADGLGLARDAGGQLTLTLPMADQLLSGIAVDDIGKAALGIFKRDAALIGKTVSIAGDHLTGDQYAAALTEVLGEEVAYRPLDWDLYRALGFPGAVEMGNMFQFYAENSQRFVGDRDLHRVRELNPQLQSFRDWLGAHVNEIAVP